MPQGFFGLATVAFIAGFMGTLGYAACKGTIAFGIPLAHKAYEAGKITAAKTLVAVTADAESKAPQEKAAPTA